MHYYPVVNHIALPMALDPLWTMLFGAVFVGVAVATARRPSYGIAAAIAAQPFAAAHYVLATTVTLPKVVLIAAIVGLLASGRRDAFRIPAVRNILVAMLAVACVLGVTIAVAAYRGDAIRETLKWIEYAALFATICVAYERDPNDALLVRCWAIVALVVAFLALLQEVIGAPSGLSIAGSIVPRIAGPLEGPNQLAGYLEIALAVLCAWYRRERLIGIAIAAGICVLALTFSRAGIAAGAIAIGTIFVVRVDARRALAAPVGAGVLLGAACTSVWIAIAHVGGVLPPVPSAFYAGGVGYRVQLWRTAIVLWERHPILGVGGANYELELASAGLPGVRTHANSWYLQSLAEGGLTLFAATLALAITLLRTLGKNLSEAEPWQIAAFAASLALVLHQVVDDLVYFTKVGGAWWILVALGASAARSSWVRRSRSVQGVRRA